MAERTRSDRLTGGRLYETAAQRSSGETARAMVGQADVLRRESWTLTKRVHVLHRQASDAELDALTNKRAAESPVEVLEYLSEQGIAWRDIASVVGVSVAAVKKWRQGETMTGENRLRLAGFAAVLDKLHDRMISDPASWLEMPIVRDVFVTGLDLLIADRRDLLIQHAVDYESVPKEAVLDAFDPEWRTTRVDDSFETVVGADGKLSIAPKSSF
ncbi:transcriptional regulator [Rathayibacter sp. PhB185]|uniref:transcriptional regulator n=2 Tax=unclassified Rathayibacter TaxID=2609250 RepID=UPI000F4C302E|nr:transcriptional regulator [Rathayibacter sp. PhB185]ROP56535.1 hypothetical protein EDF45_0055 [Rathayibacter sp. PhB186]ROS54920.1 hypothetical protein EDF44_0055 [Rathayibacter sp. PhB185]